MSKRLAQIALVAFAFILFLGKGYEVTLRGIDSNIHAAAAMSVTSGGFLPQLPIPSIEKMGNFNDHPFTLFWLNGWVMRLFGPSAWSARILTAGLGVASVLATYWIGAFAGGPVFGLVAALFLATARDVVLTNGSFSLDPALMFFILLSFGFWLNGRRWIAAGLAAGFGLWMKTPMVLLLFPAAAVTAALQGRERVKADAPKLFGAGMIAIAVGALFWGVTGALGGWDLVRDYWSRQLWGTAVGGRGAPDHQWGLFFQVVRSGFVPAFPFLLWGLVKITHTRQWRKELFQLSAVSVLIVALFVSWMRFKLGHYFNPVFPFLALLAAPSVTDWLKRREEKFYAVFTGVVLVLASFLVVTPTPLAPEAFVALSKFETFIQRNGSCQDIVALVPGGEPAGSVHDYGLHLGFYTGRTREVIECESLQANLSSRAQLPAWLIVAHENLDRCLPPGMRQKFRSAILIGNQYLFSRDVTLQPVTDLTPLLGEGKAVMDCQPPSLPRDMWHRYIRD